MNHVKIYQINNDNAQYEFMDFDFAKAHRFTLDDYQLIYDCERDTDKLDSIFSEFNINRPKDFTGHSLSVSDIVELNGKKWYCDSFGWCEV